MAMAHAWVLDRENRWNARRLDAASHDIRRLLLPDAGDGSAAPHVDGAACLLSCGAGTERRWLVIAGPDADLRVNGIPLSVGVRALEHRDEISLAGVGSAFYSAEKLAAVVPFPGADHPVACGRCHQLIQPGSPVVQCPGCGVFYDQSQALPCFNYAEHCAYCSQPTALDGDFNWVPDEG
jgi:hypothetical protein